MKALELFLSQPMVLRLGWTLVHFIWQASLIAVIAAIVLKIVKKQASTLRYAIASMSLVLVVVAGAITFTQVNVLAPLPKTISQPTIILEQAEIAPVLADTPEILPPSVNTQPEFSWPTFKKRCINFTEPTIPFIVMGWLVGVFSLSLLHLGGWAQLHRIRQQLSQPVSQDLQTRAQDIARRLGVRKVFEVFESALVQVPAAFGHLKPVILLPAQALTGLSSEQIEIILAHELAHIKRHDYLFNLFQTTIEILGFYHPAIWWLSSTIRQERENCCDDMVVNVFNNPVDYAKTLANMALLRSQQIDLAMASNGSSLVHRIERLVPTNQHNMRKPTWLATLLSLTLILSIAIPTTLAFAAQRDRRNRPASDDVTATFNEWINAIVDNDTKAFEIMAQKSISHYGRGVYTPSSVTWVQKHYQQLKAYRGLNRLKIVSMEDKGDHFDVLTSRVKDPQGVSGRLSIGISTKAKPFCMSGAMRFITETGTIYSIPQQGLISVKYIIAPNPFPLIEQLRDASGYISPDALTSLRLAVENHPNARIIAAPSTMFSSGTSASIGVTGDDSKLKTVFVNTIQRDRTNIVVDYECDISFNGEQIKSRDKVTIPSGHTICAKAHEFPDKNEALYIIMTPTALTTPQKTPDAKQIPSAQIPTEQSLLTEAFNEWLRAMKDDDPKALESIVKQQSTLWDISKEELLASLKMDAEALKRYTDLEQFSIASIEEKEDRTIIHTPIIKHGSSPEGYWSIIFQGREDPIVTDGISFVAVTGETYRLHPQVLTTAYQISSPTEFTQINQYTDSSGFFSRVQLTAFLDSLRHTEGARIVSKPRILQNSGVLGHIDTDSFSLALTNTVLSNRKTVMMDVHCRYLVENNSTVISVQVMLPSDQAIILGGRSSKNGRYLYTLIQPEIIASKSKATGVIETAPSEETRTADQNTLLTTAYICRVPKAWPYLENIIAQEKPGSIMISEDKLKAFLDALEETDSAELITSIETLCKDNESQTITCDAIKNTNIELDITHHIQQPRDMIRSQIAMGYSRTDPNNQIVSSEIETTISYRQNHAIALHLISENENDAILIILHSKSAQE